MKIRYLTIIAAAVMTFGCSVKEDINDFSNTFVTVEGSSDMDFAYLGGLTKSIELRTQARYIMILTSENGVTSTANIAMEVQHGAVRTGSYTSPNNLEYSLEASADGGGYVLKVSTVERNTSINPIYEYFIVKTAGSSIPVRVSQGIKGDTVEELVPDFYPEGGTFSTELTAAEGETIAVEPLIGGDWLTYDYDPATGKLDIDAAYWTSADGENDREGVINVTGTSEGDINYIITQEAPYVTFSKTIVLVQGTDNIQETITFTSNMPQGSIAMSEKLEDEDPDGRITVSALTYPDETSRNGSFTVSVNMEGVGPDTPVSCAFTTVGTSEAEGLSYVESRIAVSRTQILFTELFDTDLPFDSYWEVTRNTGLELANIQMTEPPLTYSDENGEYLYSGMGKSLKRDYFAERQDFSVAHTSPAFTGVTTGGTIYMSFLFKLDQFPFIDNNPEQPHYRSYTLLGFNNGGSGRAANVWVGKIQAELKYRFGITLTSGNDQQVVWCDDILFEDLDETHLLVFKLSLNGEGKFEKRADLFIDPVIGAPEPAPSISLYGDDSASTNPYDDGCEINTIDHIYAYEPNKTCNVQCQISGVCVGKTWDELLAPKSEGQTE